MSRYFFITDLEIETLTETTSPTGIFEEGKTNIYKFKLKIINTAANKIQNKIKAVAPPNRNYKVTVRLTDVDLGVSGVTNTLTIPDLNYNIPDNNEVIAGLAVGTFNKINGDTSVSLSHTTCPTVKYICIHVSHDLASSASFEDVLDNNKNCKCQNIESKRRCKPGSCH